VKIRKAIKRIVALGMGATMLGATLMSATAAAGLNAYPSPFVTGGKFSGVLVVGDNAAAEDVVGITDIMGSLQFASAVKTGTSGSTTTTTVEGDAYHFDKGSNKLNFYENASTLRQTLTDADLNALADGTLKAKSTETYEQKITSAAAAVVNEVYSDISDDPALYLRFYKNNPIIRYDLTFNSAAASDVDSDGHLEDFEDTKLNLLGNEYTITEALNKSSTAKITMMSGAVQDTLEVGQTKTYTINGQDYEVTVMIVSGDTQDNAITKLIINDEVTKSLSKDNTYTLKSGIDIGIKDVLPTKSGDVVQNLVEFYLGAQKLVLDGSARSMDIGDNTNIDDVSVDIGGSISGDEWKWSSLDINWTATQDYYVPEGKTLSWAADFEEETDSVEFLDKLGLDYHFTGIDTGNKEVVKVGRNDDDSLKLTFTNKNGVEYKVPAFWSTNSGASINLGEETGKNLTLNESTVICDEGYFAVESDEISRVMQLVDIKNTSSNHYIKVKDLGTGQTNQYDFDTTSLVANVDLDGYTYQLTVQTSTTGCVVGTKLTDDTDNYVDLWTRYGSMLTLRGNASAWADDSIVFTEDDDLQEDDNSQDSFTWKIAYDSSNSNIDFSGSVTESNELTMLTLDSDSDKSEGYSKWGTFFQRDTSGDQDEWVITIPENEAIGEVFLSAGTTTISSSGEVTGEPVIISKIDVGATKLASEVSGKEDSSNILLVGGPCANPAVEAFSDFPTCAAWPLDPGEALIQMVTMSNGNTAMLVAGTLASDTRAATREVAQMTKLKALPDGTWSRVLTTSTGVLSEFVDSSMVADDSAMMDDTTTTDTTTV